MFVVAHQLRISDDVSKHDGSELTGSGHAIVLISELAGRRSRMRHKGKIGKRRRVTIPSGRGGCNTPVPVGMASINRCTGGCNTPVHRFIEK